MDGKNELFRRLKPACVALGHTALGLSGTRGNLQAATDQLESIKHVLASVTSTTPNALDARIAEYVFFPIAQLLKVSQKLSIRCLELCLQCIAILIDQGWRQDTPAKLAAQIVILCSLLAERKPKGLSFSQTTDELQASSFWCLYHLFSVVGGNAETKNLLTSESHFPQLGQTISVVLEGIQDGSSVEAQIAATSSLDALMVNVADREIRASFLPGIVSRLTRVLTPQTKLRRNHKILIGCLTVLRVLLKSTLGDEQPLESESRINGHVASINGNTNKSIIDAKWRESAATQLKPALTNVLKLKAHSREDVKDAIASLCLTLLRDCRITLANCSQMALEALITVAAGSNESASTIELMTLICTDVSTFAMLQNLLYDWLQSLTTVMQGSDEQAKVLKLEKISAAYWLLTQSEADMSTIDRTLAAALRDSVVVILAVPSAKQTSSPHASRIQSLDVAAFHGETGSTEFASPLVRYRGQEESLAGIEKLVKMISPSKSSVSFAVALVRDLRHSRCEAQIANFWLILTAAQTTLEQESSLNDFLDFDEDKRSMVRPFIEEIYSFSLSILTDSSDDPVDPRLQALALRGLALRAQTAGHEFRYELVDALYPVLHTLATPDGDLQRASITTLNIFTSACGYTSVRELIVENVDYLTNAVALKLNAFDVSPQGPQVLLMMVRLAGPSLLPYLEDTVESIFAALEDYHGYPLLVEMLFKVLSVMAEEGVKAPQLAIKDRAAGENGIIRTEKWEPAVVESVAYLLRQRAGEEAEARKMKSDGLEPHPQKPWKTIDEESQLIEEDEASASDQQDQQMDDADLPPPAPKIYSLVFKITELTQHFLPSASGPLRTSLLALIRTTVPAMARHENSFLPLINTLWPEIVSRLDDEEPHIVATALGLIKVLCEYAGDFMRTRILQLWPRLLEIYNATSKSIVLSCPSKSITLSTSHIENTAMVPTAHIKKAISKMQAAPIDYGDTSSCVLWSSLADTVTALVQYIQLPPEIYDEALQMMEPMLEQDAVRAAFAKENADAVWLAEIRSAAIAPPGIPRAPDDTGWQFARIPE